MVAKRIAILGAAGRDFHNFNTAFRDDPSVDVVAFTATQIPGIGGRTYPAVLAGARYPKGIPIVEEKELESLIKEKQIDACVFSYSDVSYAHVMHMAALCNACGADFWLLGADRTMLESKRPVVAITAVRTGSGKSQTTRWISRVLKETGSKVVAVRHPMPYGDLAKQACQRFANFEDLTTQECTIEEREEYEPHIANGFVCYAGVDYGLILEAAEKEADIVLWDGGNNDMPFYKPSLYICIADPHRAGHETSYYPSETNFLRADVIIINKCDTADEKNIGSIEDAARRLNPRAKVIRAKSPVTLSDASMVKGKKVLVIEDGPTLTHGGMSFGAGVVAARAAGAAEIVDPTPYAVDSIAATYAKYPNAQGILPAMGYGPKQIEDLEETIRRTPCDVVVIGTPIDLTRILKIEKPMVRAGYELDVDDPALRELIVAAVKR